MEKKNDLRYYLFILAVPLIFFLHNINQAFGLISFLPLLTLFLLYVSVSTFVGAISLWLLNDRSRALLFSFVVLLFYFLFGVIHDALKASGIFGFLGRYVLFIPSVFIILSISFLVIRREKNINRAAEFLVTYLLLNLIFESGWFLFNVITDAKSKQDFGDAKNTLVRDVQITQTARKPLVFWFVFDEYAASRSLKRMYGFENPLDSLLRARNFFVADQATSSYNFTHYSLSSTLDMSYLNDRFKNHSIVSLKDLVRGEASIFDNNVTRLFQQAGYGIHNYTIFPMKNQRWQGVDWFKGTPESLIEFQTFSGKLALDIGWNFTHLFSGDKIKGDSIDGSKWLRSIDSAFDHLINRTNAAIRSAANDTSPQFYLFHYMLPHEPYFYREDGNIAYENGVNYLPRNYLSQLKYTNTIIRSIADSLQANLRDRDFVVIFQGDHGFKFEEQDPEYDRESCDILYAVYCSDQQYAPWSNKLSSVNGFRVLFNKYFQTHFPILPDSSYNLYYR